MTVGGFDDHSYPLPILVIIYVISFLLKTLKINTKTNRHVYLASHITAPPTPSLENLHAVQYSKHVGYWIIKSDFDPDRENERAGG